MNGIILIKNSAIFFIVLLTISFGFLFFFNDRKELEELIKRGMKSRDREKTIDYSKIILFKGLYEKKIKEIAFLMKLDEEELKKYYKDAFYFSVILAIVFGASIVFMMGASWYTLSIILLYPAANLLYLPLVDSEIRKYKNDLSNEIIEIFLVFHLLYPSFNNPTTTLYKIINDNKNSELNRQMEYMLRSIAEKGIEKAIPDMKESVYGVQGMDTFIELYYNLEKEGAKALQDINNYIGSIITTNELNAEKKINETKSKVEVIVFLVIFTGLTILILAPIFLGKFDGEHNLLYYLEFLQGM